MEAFIISVLTVFLSKLKTSGDDLIWLPPFLGKNKYQSAILYIIAIVLVIFLSWGTVNLTTMLINENKYISLISSICLILFALFYLKNADQTDKSSNGISKNVFLISVVGSVDEFFFFIVLFSTGFFSLIPVIIGTVAAGVLVVLVSAGLNKFTWFVKALNSVKTWLVIFIIGTISLIYSIWELWYLS